MATFYSQVPSVSSVFSLYTTFSAITMLLRTILNEVVPKGIRYITVKLVDYFSSYFQSDFTFVIEQHWGEYVENQTFRAAQVYLPTRLAGLSTGKLLVGSNNLKNPTAQPKLGIPVDTKIMDEFERIHLEWTLHNVKSKGRREKRYTLKLFVLTVLVGLFYGCFLGFFRYFHLTCKKEFRIRDEISRGDNEASRESTDLHIQQRRF